MEGLGVIALQDGYFLLVGKDLLSHIVDRDGTCFLASDWLWQRECSKSGNHLQLLSCCLGVTGDSVYGEMQ